MKIVSETTESISGAGHVVRESFWSLLKDPQVLIYPFSALIFISTTHLLIGKSIFAQWYDRIFSGTSVIVPHKIAFIVGIVGFSVFYAALISAYFSVAVSVGVLAKLEGHSTRPLYGLMQVIKHFFRVSRFAVLSVFLFPVGIYVQRDRLPKGWVGVLGSSVTLHMAQVAPEILSTQKSFFETIRDAIDILGRKWKEGLVLKIVMYLMFTLIIVLPKLIQHGFFSNPSASKIGWLISLEFGVSSYVFFKVLNSIFTTTLYHHAKHQNH